MRSRSARYAGACCAIMAMLVGQFALAAYACAAPRPVTPVAIVHMAMDAEAGQVPCSAMMVPDAPQANACEVHCTDAVTSLVPPDWPPVTLTPLPVQTLALAHLASADGVARTPLEPLPGAPPPTVRFCRLLI